MINIKKPLVIAHRGASVDAYENSKEAFQLAIKQNADMIELDTHLTEDGYFVIYHDPIIKFQGKKYIISRTKLETIQSILLPNKETIPLLEDVLKQMLPKIMFNIEIKCRIVGKVFDELLSRVGGDNSRIIVSSFKRDVLFNLKNSKMGYSLAFLCFHKSLRTRQMVKYEFIDAINPFYKLLRNNHVKFYHENNKKVFTWTVNDEEIIRNLIAKNIDGIITDIPLKARNIVQSYLE